MARIFSAIGTRLAILGVGLGIGCMYAGWESYSIASKTKDTPTAITAAQLSKSGPPRDNAYVHITDYNLNDEYIIVRKERDSNSETASWNRVWLQVMPSGGDQSGKPIIVKDESINNKDDLKEFGQKTSFDAIVMNDLFDVSPPKTPNGMNFPNIDSKKDWVVEVRTCSDAGSAITWFVVGLVFTLLGLIPVIRSFTVGRATKSGTIVDSSSDSGGPMGGSRKRR
jgi:hypothetical protein